MKAILGGIAGAVLFSAAAHAAIVQNGSFETGDFSGWTVSGGGTSPGGGPRVITTGGSNSTGYGDSVPNYDGTHAAFFVDDNAAESISQSITLAGNTNYRLSFALFATPSGANNPYSFTLSDNISGLVLNTFTNSSTNTDVPVGAWSPEFANFYTIGPDSSYTLTFNFGSGLQPAKDVLLDAVAISAVPLPASAPMFGAALVALGAAGYGLKRKAKAAA